MRPSELLRLALPLVARGHPAPLYAASMMSEHSDATAVYRCAERAIFRVTRHQFIAPGRWHQVALWTRAARLLEAEGR